jgi:putative heme-binding domain-containing protein
MRGFLSHALMLLCSAPPGTPHNQDRPPNDPYPAAVAAKRMTVPAGFTVEVVAAEPDIVNPVAMTFDERGRIWVCESLEYPRRAAGPGRDRVKILEDTDGDGKIDKVTVFADGLNIPSGIALGHGGVWVANAPDLLFLRDTDGDGKADTREVVVTGFGRSDTHELPNSLTWGPDGWLYGLNGVFNPGEVRHQGKTHRFTAAMFRVHPKTRAFELFAEGTSNPWGIAWTPEGEPVLSACVIDHLWHLTETGRYRRQAGPQPPFAWPLGSIVNHKHQKAAYCGIHWFDSDAYPPEYRRRLYMGNIHGGCINCDALDRDGASYRGKPLPDFLTANDAWFMPVSQQTGPDGCLYVLDWYDRYHCYQDANRDPAGIDRLKGRLYRVRHAATPRRPAGDLGKLSDDELIALLGGGNGYVRDTARRLLVERGSAGPALERLALATDTPADVRIRAVWALISRGPLAETLHQKLLAHADPQVRAWAVRAAGNQRQVAEAVRDAAAGLARDRDVAVRLQAAIAAPKLRGLDPVPVLVEVLARGGDDRITAPIVWQNLHPLLDDRADTAVAALTGRGRLPRSAEFLPRVVERLLAGRDADPRPAADLFAALVGSDPPAARACLAALAGRVQTGELAGSRLAALRERLRSTLDKLPADDPLAFDAALLAVAWKEPRALAAVRVALADTKRPEPVRLAALAALVAVGDAGALDTARAALVGRGVSGEFRGQVLATLGRLDDARVADMVLAAYPALGDELRPRAVEVLVTRPVWAKALLAAVARKEVPASAVGVNQVRALLASKDAELVKQVRAQWGSVRAERNPAREQVIAQMRAHLRATPGDAAAGQKVFRNFCGQCHKIHGEGQDVGPDVTANGRSTFEQLLSNVFDPSLVIGTGYQMTTVQTTDGRTLSGVLVEDTPQRVVLKLQGGNRVTVPRDDVEAMQTSALSLMPEGVEQQLKPQELADLFAFLALDRPPGDPAAKPLFRIGK